MEFLVCCLGFVVFGLDFVQEIQQHRGSLHILRIQPGLLKWIDSRVKLANAEQVVAQEKLQVCVKTVELHLFAQAVNLCEERLVIGIQAARIENAFFIRGNTRQSCSKDLGCCRILLIGEEGLSVCKRKYHIFGGELPCFGELRNGYSVLAGFKRTDSSFEKCVSQGSLVGFYGFLLGQSFANICKGRVVYGLNIVCYRIRLRHDSLVITRVVVVVRVVVVCIAFDFAGDRIVTVPVVRMASIPVIAGVCVSYWPVAAYADENVSAQMVGVNVPKRMVPTVAIIYGKMVPGPDYSVAYPVVAVPVYVLVAVNVPYRMGTVVLGPRGGSSSAITVGSALLTIPSSFRRAGNGSSVFGGGLSQSGGGYQSFARSQACAPA